MHNISYVITELAETDKIITMYSKDFKLVQIFNIINDQIKESFLLNFDSDFKTYVLEDFNSLLLNTHNKIYYELFIGDHHYNNYPTNLVNLAKFCKFTYFGITNKSIQVKYSIMYNKNKFEFNGNIFFKRNILNKLQKLIIEIKKIKEIAKSTNQLLYLLTNEKELMCYKLTSGFNLNDLYLDFDNSHNLISDAEIIDIVKLLIIYDKKNLNKQQVLTWDIFKFVRDRNMYIELFGNNIGDLTYGLTEKHYFSKSQQNCFSYLKQKNLLDSLKHYLQYNALTKV